MSGDKWHEDTCHVTHGRELVAGETHGEPCVHLHERGLVYGFGSDMCHTHGIPNACHVEVKWLIYWLYIWTSSSVHGSAAKRKGKGRREKKERKKRNGEEERERKE